MTPELLSYCMYYVIGAGITIALVAASIWIGVNLAKLIQTKFPKSPGEYRIDTSLWNLEENTSLSIGPRLEKEVVGKTFPTILFLLYNKQSLPYQHISC